MPYLHSPKGYSKNLNDYLQLGVQVSPGISFHEDGENGIWTARVKFLGKGQRQKFKSTKIRYERGTTRSEAVKIANKFYTEEYDKYSRGLVLPLPPNCSKD